MTAKTFMGPCVTTKWSRHYRVATTVAATLLVAGCSFQTALDRLVDPARQTRIIADAQTLCSDVATLRPRFEAGLWTASAPRFADLPRECPSPDAQYVITGYRFNSYTDANGVTNRQEFATVVGADVATGVVTGVAKRAGTRVGDRAGTADVRWSEITINYTQIGTRSAGPPMITGWQVSAAAQPPQSLTARRAWDNAVSWIGIVAIAAAIILTGGGIWLVRRVRSRGARSLFDA